MCIGNLRRLWYHMIELKDISKHYYYIFISVVWLSGVTMKKLACNFSSFSVLLSQCELKMNETGEQCDMFPSAIQWLNRLVTNDVKEYMRVLKLQA